MRKDMKMARILPIVVWVSILILDSKKLNMKTNKIDMTTKKYTGSRCCLVARVFSMRVPVDWMI